MEASPAPEPFHHRTDDRALNHAEVQNGGEREVKIAQTEQILRKELRNASNDMTRSPSSSKKHHGSTRPSSPPKFHKIHRRQLPKSTEEREEEMMNYFMSHPFKATPLPVEFSSRERAGRTPVSPKKATSPLRSSRISKSRKSTEEVSMAQSEHVLRHALRNSSIEFSPRRRSTTDKGVTHAEAPKFHSIHERERPKSTEEKEKETMAYFNSHPFKATPVPAGPVSSAGSHDGGPFASASKHATNPKPFRFRSEERALEHPSRASPESEEEVSLAQSEYILRNALRNSNRDFSPSKPRHTSRNEVTRPESPKFHHIHQRDLPTSAEQKEIQLMKEFKSQPFEARALPVDSFAGEDGSTSVTEPRQVSSRFRSEQRASLRQKLCSAYKETDDFKESKKQFRALPMPKTTHPPSSPVHRARKKADQHKPFRAREAPKSTYVSPSRVRRSDPSVLANGEPPFLPDLKPFHLESERRHEAYQKQAAERRKQQEKEEKEKTQFHARPLPKTTRRPHSSPRSTRSVLGNRKQVPARSSHKVSVAGTSSASPDSGRSATVNAVAGASSASPDSDRSAAVNVKEAPAGVGKKPSKPNTPPASPRSTGDASDTLEQMRNSSSNQEGTSTASSKEGASTGDDGGVGEQTSSMLQPVTRGNGKKPERNGEIPEDMMDPDELDLNRWLEEESIPLYIWVPRPVMSWSLIGMICIIRVLNTLLIQSYFDPDEFWQTMEPAYCQAFVEDRPCPGFTWEWKRRPPSSMDNLIDRSLWGPARTYTSILPTYIFYVIVKTLGIDTHWMISRGPLVLNSLIVAAPVDIAVWYAAWWLPDMTPTPQEPYLPAWCLFCSLTSWFNGYSLVRTFANGQETLFLIVAIVLVSPEFMANWNSKRGLLRACGAFFLGGLSASIRFTSLAAFVPMGIVLALRRYTFLGQLGYLFFPCAFFGLLGLGVGMLVDYMFYGFWTLPFLGNFHFNVVLNYAGLYGTHPFPWYFAIGFPAIAGLLLPFLLWDLGFGEVNFGQQNLWFMLLTYILIMSFNGHKEFRYIHPVLPVVCLLTTRHVRTVFRGRTGSKTRIVLFALPFIAINLLVVAYLGLFHQSGPIKVNHDIVAASQQRFENFNMTGHQDRPPSISVHYLTGACHSTPLLSNLHSPPLVFEPWALDCSPRCRANPNVTCEAELFAKHPSGFVRAAYFSKPKKCSANGGKTGNGGSQQQQNDNDKTCTTYAAPPYQAPDFLVTFSHYEQRIQRQLEALGLREVARYPHHVNGARIGDWQIGDDFGKKPCRMLTVVEGVTVGVEEMILFSKLPLSHAKHESGGRSGDGSL